MTRERPELHRSLSSVDSAIAYYAERMQAQIRFADALCDLRPDEAEGWGKHVDRAAEIARRAAEDAGTPDMAAMTAEVEQALAPLQQAAGEYTIYCVGHAHIDMNWQWSWPETVSVTIDTFTTVLRLMEEFPQFVFSQSQASVYEILERHHPEMLQAVAERVRQKRWEVTASHWVEGDKNLASAESLCRHLLYTRRYMQSLFGLEPQDVAIDWSPDTFGHAHTVPTYLAQGGVKYYYLHRPGVHGDQTRYQAFWWQGPDGSRVLTRNDMSLGYNGVIRPDTMVDTCLVSFCRETGLRFAMFVYGVGDHGGGPTRRDLLRGLDMMSWPVYPTIVFARAHDFYARLEEEGRDLPVLDCELNYEFTGCYTTQTLIKKANRFGEKRLVDAETAASLAWAGLGHTYPARSLEEGWRDTLFSHFHDILPGSGVRDTRTYAHGQYQRTMAMTGAEETKALRKLAAMVDTSAARVAGQSANPLEAPQSLGAGVGRGAADGGISDYEYRSGADDRPMVLFNPLPGDRSEVVEATLWDVGPVPPRPRDEDSDTTSDFSVTDPVGREVGAQVVETGRYWGHEFTRIAFPADLPGLGHTTVVTRMRPCSVPAHGARQIGYSHPCGYALYERGPEGLDNGLIRLEIDPETGSIMRLQSAEMEEPLIDAPAGTSALLRFAVERPRGMSAWAIEHTGPEIRPQVVSITRQATGPYTASIAVALKIRESSATLTYELRAGDPRLFLHLQATWVERGGPEIGTPVLGAVFPLAIAEPRGFYEIPFGAIERDLAHGEEVPALRWAAVHGRVGNKEGGCLLVNDSKHGHSLIGSSLRLTLIRSSYDPDPLPEIGVHEVHAALAPYAGALDITRAIESARRFDHPVRVVSTDAHEGALATTGRFLTWDSESLVLGAIKKSEDSDSLIVRVHNPTPKTAMGTLFAGELLAPIAAVEEVDLMERPRDGSTAELREGEVTVTVPGKSLTSLRLTL